MGCHFLLQGIVLSQDSNPSLLHCRQILYQLSQENLGVGNKHSVIAQFCRYVMSDSLWSHGLQHAKTPCPSPTPRVYSTHVHWVSDAIQPSHSLVIPFSSCLQSFPASGSFQMSQFFTSRGQSIGVSASASVLPMNIKDWSPLGWTGWISLLSQGLSRVFFNTTVQKHQFFSAQLSLQSNSHIHTWPLENHSLKRHTKYRMENY